MIMYQTVKLEIKDKTAWITLNRPETFNSFEREMSREFLEVLDRCENDANVRALVISGEGKAFCAGQDLKDVLREDFSFEEAIGEGYNPIITKVRSIGKPVIGRLNGVAAGAGASLALACDYVVASEKARLLWAFVNIGLVLDSGSSWFLPRQVGHRKAFELATLGKPVSAEDALALGLVNQVVPVEELDAAVEKVARQYVAAPPLSIKMMKEMLNRSYRSSLQEMLELEKEYQTIAGSTADYREGLNAFLEKRKPEFKG
jgi:2-(1,2-epoxy-1,2-dihydrophenyl)acetyl-CoA isomerase